MMAAILPPELLLRVLNFARDSDLIRASHVSQSWRATAHDHPSFWRDVQVTNMDGEQRLSRSRREKLLTRLAHKPDAPARFHCDATIFHSSAAGPTCEPVLVPILAAQTHRFVTLHLELDRDLGVVETLSKVSAPVLEVLSLA